MRFNFATFVLALSATTVAARAVNAGVDGGLQSRSLVTDVGGLVGGLLDGLGVNEILSDVDGLLGGKLTELEDKLGISFAEKILGLAKNGASKGTLQAVGEAIAKLLSGLGVDEINAELDAATGGAISSLEEALGVTDIEKAIGLIN